MGKLRCKGPTHRCRSKQIFGDANNFYPNFPKLARKKLQRKWPPKTNGCISLCAFSNQATSSNIFTQISPKLPKFPLNVPKRTKLKHDLQKKNVCILILGAIFVKSKHMQELRRFTHILPKFPQIFPGFSPNQSFGVAVAPPVPRLLHQ